MTTTFELSMPGGPKYVALSHVYIFEFRSGTDSRLVQLLDDVKILAAQSDDLAEGGARIPASLLSGPNGVFQEHLQSRSQAIQSTLSALFSSLPPTSSPDVSELQGRLSTLLAAEKGHQMELERVQTERDNLVERLETASLRYMIAEKKLDRAKSAAIAKLERAGTMGGNNDTGSGGSGGADKMANGAVANGTTDHAKANSQLETARGAAVAVMDKQKEQLEKLEAENQGLTGQVTDLTVKLSNLNDDDYTRSDVFKHLKSQYEDVIKRINGLEATNLELRQEAEKLQAERTAYKVQVESEVQASVEEVQSELERVQNDLARIRATRDELQNVMMVNKASQGTEIAAYAQIRELAAAREDRIVALESELERARIKTGETTIDAVVRPDPESMSEDDLRKRYHSLEREYALLSNELPSLGAAWKKASALASKKVSETAASQERMARLQAEKVKADQKYFAQMKLNESKQMELQALRRQNAQSAEVIAQLKDAEKATRALVVNLEKQVAETKEAITTLTTQNNALHQQVVHTAISTDSTKAQMGDLVNMMKKKDAALSTTLKSQRQGEREAEHLKVMLADSKKTATDLQAAAAGNVTHEFEALHVRLPIGRIQTMRLPLLLLLTLNLRHSPTAISVDLVWSIRPSNSVGIPSAGNVLTCV